MILTCPSCGTRYVVKDGSIPEGGRTVRCAQCKHSWHQGPEPADAAAFADEPTTAVPEQGHPQAGQAHVTDELADNRTEPVPTAALGDHAHPDLSASPDETDSQTLPGPGVRPQASSLAGPVEPVADPQEPEPDRDTMPAEAADAPDPYPEEVVPAEPSAPERHPLRASRVEAEDLYSPFAAQDEEEPAPRRRWPLILLLVLLAVAGIAAAIAFLAPPELKSRFGLAQANGQTPLLLQFKQHSRQQLASGNQMLEVSGLVINPTDETQAVPPLQAQLRTLEQEVVYKWTIPPPTPRLAPGGSASFHSAELNIPAAAACLEVFFGSPREPHPPCSNKPATAGA